MSYRVASVVLVVASLSFVSALHARDDVSPRVATSPAGAAAGRVEEFSIPSTVYGHARRIWVYTPPRYDATRTTPYDLVIAFDGAQCLDEIGLPSILDKLVTAGRMAPAVAVLIDDGNGRARLDDLANHAAFARFLADEVLAWIHARYDVTNDPHHTIVTGSSAGGLAAAYVAFVRPDRFGNVLSQSGAFWRGNEGSNREPWEWLTNEYAKAPARDIRFVLEVGSLEWQGAMGGEAPSIAESNRRLFEVLQARGYRATFAVVPGGRHDAETWKARLPAALAAISSAAHPAAGAAGAQ